jgi:hypothetical protein
VIVDGVWIGNWVIELLQNVTTINTSPNNSSIFVRSAIGADCAENTLSLLLFIGHCLITAVALVVCFLVIAW